MIFPFKIVNDERILGKLKVKSFSQYWHTVRYLRPRQLYHQINRRVFFPRVVTKVDAVPCFKKIDLTSWPERQESYLGGGKFRFLNAEFDLGLPVDWAASGASRLWKYNLHYFDFLHQSGMDWASGLELIQGWMQGNSISRKNVGWEPYTLSLRLVNWIKFFACRSDQPEDVLNSLMLQAINLKRRVEYHILGNHLWANGKALWFAGTYLELGDIAGLGREIILKEMKEQFLPDGGHFELSPMYHSTVLEDLLDLINLLYQSGKSDEKEDLEVLRKQARSSLSWLSRLVDEEGNIPLLNDSAYGVASSYKKLRSYAEKLDISPDGKNIYLESFGPWTGYNLSGYWVLRNGPLRLIFDTAGLGPDYLPGHAHCDMLSVLLDFKGQNILTDTGVFEYEEGRRRLYARGSSAHNTVVLDGFEQAEIWKSFRMGRRGRPSEFQRTDTTLRCAHNGFAIWRSGLSHERILTFLDDGFEIIDQVGGPGNHNYEAYFHFAPGVRIKPLSNRSLMINERLVLTTRSADQRLTTSEYYPEFGKIIERSCLVLSGNFSKKTSFGIRCTYSF